MLVFTGAQISELLSADIEDRARPARRSGGAGSPAENRSLFLRVERQFVVSALRTVISTPVTTVPATAGSASMPSEHAPPGSCALP
jgi:hypothetical protein